MNCKYIDIENIDGITRVDIMDVRYEKYIFTVLDRKLNRIHVLKHLKCVTHFMILAFIPILFKFSLFLAERYLILFDKLIITNTKIIVFRGYVFIVDIIASNNNFSNPNDNPSFSHHIYSA